MILLFAALSDHSATLPSCFYDTKLDEHTCTATSETELTVPCGEYGRDSGQSFSYYVAQFSGKRTTIASKLDHFLRLNVTLEEDRKYVCCQPNTSVEPVCYRLDVTCEECTKICWMLAYTVGVQRVDMSFLLCAIQVQTKNNCMPEVHAHSFD